MIAAANCVPTYKNTGHPIVHRINIRIKFPPVTKYAGTANAIFTIPANGRSLFPGKTNEKITVIGIE